MAQPTITANSQAYNPADNNAATTRTFSSVTIPATANTVFILFALDATEASRTITNISSSDSTLNAVRSHFVDVSPSANIRSTGLAIYDTSTLGALSVTITGTASSSSTNKGILGVVTTDGYLESFAATGERSSTVIESASYSGNHANTTMVLMGSKDGGVGSFSFTTGTEIFATEASAGGISMYAGKQSTNGTGDKLGVKEIVAAKGDTEECSELTILISSQPNPYADIDPRGDIISHDIITN